MIIKSGFYSTIQFSSLDRLEWIKEICGAYEALQRSGLQKMVLLSFSKIPSVDLIMPIHVVTLACLIDVLAKSGFNVSLHRKDDDIGEYLFTDLKLREYWGGGQNYVIATDASIFNLWRLRDEEKEIMPMRVYEYFKRSMFKNKDLATLRLSLDEAYYNVFDHADAKGVAFSFIKYDTTRSIIHIAVCDFGKGIPTTVRGYRPEIGTDVDALSLAMQDKFTIRSQGYNQGMGLGNIRNAGCENDSLWIFSNNARSVSCGDETKYFSNGFYFPGTVLFYSLRLANFEDEEIIDNFEL